MTGAAAIIGNALALLACLPMMGSLESAAAAGLSLLARSALTVEVVLVEGNRRKTSVGQNCWAYPGYGRDPAVSNSWAAPSPFADMNVPGHDRP